ncbi:MFS-type transporter SLC18B1-like isoform X2 [Tachypleus tridentatus]|uniref:MFS-type transporter SLC18B1-like isoform X2 n=1 Tax=Tachypleus tridentatus TaxID=6853 RepID=UPI003FD61C51
MSVVETDDARTALTAATEKIIVSQEAAQNNSEGISTRCNNRINKLLTQNSLRQWAVLTSQAYGQFCLFACISVQAPFFPQEAEKKGASPTEYGLIFGIFEFTVLLASPIYGKLMFHISPKFLLTSGTFVAGICSILFGFIDRARMGTTFIILAFLIRTLEGLGSAAFQTASYSIVAAEFTDRTASAFAILETFGGLGLISGPAIGGALFEQGGYPLPFLVLGGLLVFETFLVYLVVPDSVSETTNNTTEASMKKFLADGDSIIYGAAVTMCLIIIGYNTATLEPHIRQFQLSPFLLGAMFTICGGTYAISAPIWGKIADKKCPPMFMVFIGCLLSSVTLLTVGPAPFLPFDKILWLVIVSLFLNGVANGAKIIGSFTGVLESAKIRGFPDNFSTYGLVSALFTFCRSLGATLGPSFGGFIFENIGYRAGTMVLLAAELLLMTFIIIHVAYRSGWQKTAQ